MRRPNAGSPVSTPAVTVPLPVLRVEIGMLAQIQLDFVPPLTSKTRHVFEISGSEIAGSHRRASYLRKHRASYRPFGKTYPRFQT